MTEATTPQDAVRQANTSLINATQRRSNPGQESLGKEDFLHLLMTQVTHQDPLNPLDSQGMMDQLTQMGALEQLVNLNKQMGKLHGTQEEIVRSTAYSFLDKDVTVQGGRATVRDGAAPQLQFSLPREAAKVKVVISDEDGAQVRTVELGQMAPGRHQVAWDVKDDDGDAVADGRYRYAVTARTPEDQSMPVGMFTKGKVNGVKFAEGRPVLLMNGEEIDLSDVLEVSNVSQKLFGNRDPRPLQEALQPKPPVDERRQ